MNKIIQDILLIVMIIIAIGSVLMLVDVSTRKTINCDIAEISPDFTPSMRLQCRQLREAK
jgi:hypothetical protein